MRRSQSGFTLIEILIVIGIIAILGMVVVVTVNPAEVVRRARDTERLDELKGINRGLQYADLYGANPGNAQTVYISLPDSSPTCDTYTYELPVLEPGWTYACAPEATYRNVDGTGWIPVNFTASNIGIYEALPIDPENTTAGSFYYTYTPGGSWVLTAALESLLHLQETATKDTGTDPNRFEVGTDLALWNQSGAIDGELPSPPGPPTIATVTPSSGSRDATLTLTISGTNFVGASTVSLSGTKIGINSTSYINPTQLLINISIEHTAQKNARDVIVTTPQGSVTCAGCFTVTN